MSAEAHVLPPRGRLLGVDYGTIRVGLAVCDPDRILASPLETYVRQNSSRDAEFFRQLVVREQIVGLVVGLPVYPSGDESEKSLEARAYARWLTSVTNLPVALLDERYTSNQAERLMSGLRLTREQRKKRRDMLAAQILLATYLESPHSASGPPGAIEDEGGTS